MAQELVNKKKAQSYCMCLTSSEQSMIRRCDGAYDIMLRVQDTTLMVRSGAVVKALAICTRHPFIQIFKV